MREIEVRASRVMADAPVRLLARGDHVALLGPAGELLRCLDADLREVSDPDGALPGVSAAGQCPGARSGERYSIRSSGDEIIVRRHAAGGEVLGDVRFPDPFGDSEPELHLDPATGRRLVWVNAGQLGYRSWLISEGGAGLRPHLLRADDAPPPRFEPGHRWFVAADDDGVRRLSWPDQRELGSLGWPNESDPAGTELNLLPGGYACWPSENGRLLILDLASMSVVDEAVFAGHPMRTVGEIFPRLAGDDTPCSDYESSVVIGPGDRACLVVLHRGAVLTASRLAELSPDPTRAL